jgi:hypothetical protein
MSCKFLTLSYEFFLASVPSLVLSTQQARQEHQVLSLCVGAQAAWQSMCRYGWDCSRSLLKGLLSLGTSSKSLSTLRALMGAPPEDELAWRDRQMTGRDEVFITGGATAPTGRSQGLAPVVEGTRIGAAAGQLLRRLRPKGAEGKEKRVSADGHKEAASRSSL